MKRFFLVFWFLSLFLLVSCYSLKVDVYSTVPWHKTIVKVTNAIPSKKGQIKIGVEAGKESLWLDQGESGAVSARNWSGDYRSFVVTVKAWKWNQKLNDWDFLGAWSRNYDVSGYTREERSWDFDY